MNDVTNGIVSLVEGGFQFGLRSRSGIRLVVKEAVGQRSAKLFMKEDEDQCDFGSFIGEPVSVALAIPFQQAVRLQLAQIVTELIEPVTDGADSEGSEDGVMNVFGPPSTHGGAAVQEDLHQTDHTGIVNFNAGELRSSNRDW